MFAQAWELGGSGVPVDIPGHVGQVYALALSTSPAASMLLSGGQDTLLRSARGGEGGWGGGGRRPECELER